MSTLINRAFSDVEFAVANGCATDILMRSDEMDVELTMASRGSHFTWLVLVCNETTVKLRSVTSDKN